MLRISNTLYTSKFFVLVFGCHILLTLGSLCFSQYICTAHYSILQFPVFVHSLFTCFACIMCSRFQHYKLNVIHMQFGNIIVYLYYVQQLVPFDVNYTL